MRASFFPIVSALFLCGLATGCLMDPSPPPPPFRIAAYGPGLDVASKGKLFQIQDEQHNVQGRVRVTTQSMYLQWANAQPIGSIRTVEKGHAFRLPGGKDICQTSDTPGTVQCGNTTWRSDLSTTMIHVTSSDNGDASNTVSVPTTIEPSIRVGGTRWSNAAISVLDAAYEHLRQNTDDIDEFAAYALIAWSLRDHTFEETDKRTH